MGCCLIALAVPKCHRVECLFLTAGSREVPRKSPGTCSPETRVSERAGESRRESHFLVAAVHSLLRQKRRQGGRKQTRARGTCALNRTVCASGCVCEDAELLICFCNQESQASRSHASGWGVKSRQPRSSNKQTGSFFRLCSPFLSRSRSPSGSSISIFHALLSLPHQDLAPNQSNCQC